MTVQKSIYRKNFSLIVAFMVLLTAILGFALLIGYGLTRKFVENEFYSKKIEVLDQTSALYNEFFQNKIAEITAYQGFLNRTSAGKYAASVFGRYPFVNAIDFYHFTLSNTRQAQVLKVNNLSIGIKSIYHFSPAPKTGKVITKALPRSILQNNDDFKQMALKFVSFVQTADTAVVYGADVIFKTFYDVKPNKINYVNIPRAADVQIYQDLLSRTQPSSHYQQDMMTFYLNPYNLNIVNNHPELYQIISVRQVIYDPLDNQSAEDMITEVSLPGAFADYKLYFKSERKFINAEVISRFLPIAGLLLLIYLFVVTIGWLIYRNLNINHKLFKLQYDFINNFTHEFKTPVSVIKIAGSNLKNDTYLTDRQRAHYGKILDEEADKLNELMNKLLSFTQIENRSIPLHTQEVDLTSFVQNYLDTFRMKYPDFNLAVELKSVSLINTDPVLLGSIFQNLIENAYKYSPPQRKELQIIIEGFKREVVFLFKDKGIGIPRKELDNVFKKFYRIENQYNQNGSAGLGLAFCKELINFMHGEITVKSKLNEGSEFKIVLPN